MNVTAIEPCAPAKSGHRKRDAQGTEPVHEIGPTPRQLMSVPELALESNESEAVWRKRIFRKEIPYIKLGRNVRVRRAEFESFLEARLVCAESRAALR